MAAQTYVGTFAKRTGTGTQAITGMGFKPKALFFWSMGATVADSGFENADLQHYFGLTDDSLRQAGVSHTSGDGLTSSDTAMGHRNDKALIVVDLGGTLNSLGAVQSMDADGFTVDWTVSTGAAGILINFVAIGGADVAAYVGDVAARSTAGTQAITGVGFEPTAVIFLSYGTTDGSAATSASFGFGPSGVGWAVSADKQEALDCDALAPENPSQAARNQSTAACVSAHGFGPSSSYQASLVGFDADGFSLNWTTVAASGGRLPFLALRGVGVDVGSFAQPTAAGIQTIPTTVTPQAIIVASTGVPTDGPATDGRFCFGASDGVRQRVSWSGDVNGVSPTRTARRESTMSLSLAATPAAAGGSSTLLAEAGVETLAFNYFQLNWTTVDATIRQVMYLAIGAPLVATAFANEPEIDLVWRETIGRTGETIVESEVDLPDRDRYFHGLKRGLLTEVGEIDRHLSDPYGEHNVPSFTSSVFDEGGAWRARAVDPTTLDFAGTPQVIRGITDAGRRAEQTPRVIFRGVVREHHWTSDTQLQFVCEDPLSAELAVNNDKAQLPKASVNIDDFPGCAATKVPSSAESYVVNGAHSIGATTILVRSGVGQFAAADQVTFGIGADVYAVSSSSRSSNTMSALLASETAETQIVISPALISGLSDGEAIVQIPAHTVPAAVGTPVPFWFGMISDTKVAGSSVTLPGVDGALPVPVQLGLIGRAGDLRTPLNPSGRRWCCTASFKLSTNKLSPHSAIGGNVARDDDYSNPSGGAENFSGDPSVDGYYTFFGDAPNFDPYSVPPNPGSGHYLVYVTHDNVTHDGEVPGSDFETLLSFWNQPSAVDLLGGTSAVGKGQGPMKWVGDEVIGGRLTGIFLWGGHQCYAPGGSPFISVNFWDTVVDVATLGASGGRIAVPGSVRWSELGFTGTYITRNGRDYTVIGLQGVLRD
jgi:hypothetical protein